MLQSQVSILRELVNTANETNSFNVREVMTVRTICDMMNETSIGKMFSEVLSLIRLYLTIPMTSATAEHTFSTLQLKNYLQIKVL